MVQSLRYLKRFYVRRFCQQCKPEHEAGALWKSDPQKSDGASGRAYGNANDESNLDVDDCAEGM